MLKQSGWRFITKKQILPHQNTKTCPRCQQSFECKKDDVTHCQCASVKLFQAQRDAISQQYKDCLCANCLEQLRREIE